MPRTLVLERKPGAVEDWITKADLLLRRMGWDTEDAGRDALDIIASRVDTDTTAWQLLKQWFELGATAEGSGGDSTSVTWKEVRDQLLQVLGAGRRAMPERIARIERLSLSGWSNVVEFENEVREAFVRGPKRSDPDHICTLLRAVPKRVAVYIKEKCGCYAARHNR